MTNTRRSAGNGSGAEKRSRNPGSTRMLGGETQSKALSILALLSLAVLGVTLVAMAGPGDNKTAANGKKTNAKAAAAPQPLDEEYTAKIKEYTTEKYFTTELVDHLPASATVPSPEKVLGYVIGAPNKLTYSKDIYRYYRALAAATPRVKVFTTGKTEEGREFMLVAVSDDANIKNLDRLKDITAKLADPRKTNDAEADKLIGEGKPFYWLVGSIHSPETGSPEMLMELAYRLAVENSPLIENIRKNSVVLITPVLEVDGRDREVDVYNYTKANPEKPAPNLIYWGHYVQHDNNRDAIDMALALSKEQLKTMFDWHATVVHDLHESIPFLYTIDGHRTLQRVVRSDRGERMAENGLSRNRKFYCPRSARRVDARLLRRLGTELHAHDRQRAQCRRPLLRNIWQRRRGHEGAHAFGLGHFAPVVSRKSAVAEGELVHARQHELRRERRALRDGLHGDECRRFSAQLLFEEQAQRGEARQRRSGSVGDPE